MSHSSGELLELAFRKFVRARPPILKGKIFV